MMFLTRGGNAALFLLQPQVARSNSTGDNLFGTFGRTANKSGVLDYPARGIFGLLQPQSQGLDWTFVQDPA
jgi:hypothetical protein